METLRISPKYTAQDWEKLDKMKPEHWPQAVAIVRDRLHGRFLHFADKCLQEVYSGFVVLSIDCLLAEAIQQFIEGAEFSKNPRAVFKRFLGRPRFRPYFTHEKVRKDFYTDIRCGLLHQAEAKNQWLVRRDLPELLKPVGTGYIINVKLFHDAVKASLDDYLTDVCKPENDGLRENLWKKMAFICNVRMTRGPMELLDASAADPTA